MAKSSGENATTILLIKLGILTIMGMMDCWKLFMTFRNLSKTLSVKETPEMTALQVETHGYTKARRTATSTGVSNIFEMLIIIYLSLDRFFRIAFRLNALHWDSEEKELLVIPTVMSYMLSDFFITTLPVYIFRILTVGILDGLYIRRNILTYKEAFEVLFVNGWIFILTGLANDEVLDSWIFGALGVVVSIQEYIFWLISISVEGGVFHEDLEDKTIRDKLNTLWDFPIENVRVSERSDWEVKYVGALGHNELVIDSNVVLHLHPEHVCALASLELGQWYYRHSVGYYLLPLIRTAALGAVLMFSYNNPTVNELFGFTRPPHPTVPMFNAYMWLWPCIREVINYTESLFSCWIVRRGDAIALERHSVAELTTALNHVAGTTEHYPIYDNCYSVWLLGRPTVRSRIQRWNRIRK